MSAFPPPAPPAAPQQHAPVSAAPTHYAPSPARAPRLDPAGVRPTIAVAALIALLFFGSQLVNAVIPGTGDVGQSGDGGVDIGVIRVQLADGWYVSDEAGGTRVAKGSVAIDILDVDFEGDPSSLYEGFVAEALAPNATGFEATDPALVVVGGGMPAARGGYAGIFGQANEVEGQLTAFVVEGHGYVFDAWSHVGGLTRLLPEVELMIDSVQVRR